MSVGCESGPSTKYSNKDAGTHERETDPLRKRTGEKRDFHKRESRKRKKETKKEREREREGKGKGKGRKGEREKGSGERKGKEGKGTILAKTSKTNHCTPRADHWVNTFGHVTCMLFVYCEDLLEIPEKKAPESAAQGERPGRGQHHRKSHVRADAHDTTSLVTVAACAVQRSQDDGGRSQGEHHRKSRGARYHISCDGDGGSSPHLRRLATRSDSSDIGASMSVLRPKETRIPRSCCQCVWQRSGGAHGTDVVERSGAKRFSAPLATTCSGSLWWSTTSLEDRLWRSSLALRILTMSQAVSTASAYDAVQHRYESSKCLWD